MAVSRRCLGMYIPLLFESSHKFTEPGRTSAMEITACDDRGDEMASRDMRRE
jgi:hypothetical protein